LSKIAEHRLSKRNLWGIPVGVSSEVWIPIINSDYQIKHKDTIIWANGKYQSKFFYIRFIKHAEKYVVFNLDSGDYEFLVLV
jgi:hypothetical protein